MDSFSMEVMWLKVSTASEEVDEQLAKNLLSYQLLMNHDICQLGIKFTITE